MGRFYSVKHSGTQVAILPDRHISMVKAGLPESHKPFSPLKEKEREEGKQFLSKGCDQEGELTTYIHISLRKLFNWSHRAARKAEIFSL